MDPQQSPVNSFQIKRKAHRLSRMDGSASTDRWNPFRHVWAGHHQRSQTWDGSRAEMQTEPNPNVDDDTNGSPIEHIQTAPHPFRDLSQENANERTSKDVEAFQRTQSSDDTVVPPTADTTAPGMRLRKSERSERDAATPTTAQENEKPKKDHRLFKRVTPKEPFTVGNQIKRTLLSSWINVLLVAAPVGIALGAIPNMNNIAIFVVNFIAIIPLAAMLSFATEEIALRTGETLGGLLNASFG